MEKFNITTPIYYANDVPHIGHAYTTIAADTVSRWYKLNKKKVFFMTGTDEHGSKIFEAAASKNREPMEYCNEISGQFRHAWKELNIEYDYFIRTTDINHIKTVEHILTKLFEKNDIYKMMD